MFWKVLASTAIIVSCMIALLQASLYKSTSDRELERYQLRNKVLHDLLISEECMEDRMVRKKREILSNSKDQTLLEVELKVYHHLGDLLISCRKSKAQKLESSTKSTSIHTSTTSPPTTTTPTTKTPTTATPTPIMTTTDKPSCKHQKG